MSDEEKPKPMSLKERIAALNQQQASQSAAPPPPRAPAKPANWAWKQKLAEGATNPPPATPSTPPATAITPASSVHEVDERASDHKAGMSANDAAEAIKGLSLKERMAALKGQGFGAPATDPPSRPAGEKPKVWKRPTVPPSDEAADVSTTAFNPPLFMPGQNPVRAPSSDDTAPRALTPGVEEEAGESPSIEGAPEDAQPEEQPGEEVDEEEQERQRRAALAARMAKLGGARVGMGAQVFGRPPIKPKPPALSASPQNDGMYID